MPTTTQSLMDPATPSAPIQNTPTMSCYTGYETFPKPPPRVIPLTTFWQSKPWFEGAMTDDDSDLLHAQYRLSLLQRNAGAARRQPTRLATAMCGAFNAVLLQEARDHVQHISDLFQVCTDDDDLAYPIIEESTSKTAWGLKALVVCGHLRRPPVGAPKTVTFCTVHLHNVVAKKRDTATSILQRLYVHMKLLEVDFVGGDFNSAAKGIIADVFNDPEFMAPGSIPLWGAGALEGSPCQQCRVPGRESGLFSWGHDPLTHARRAR